MTDLLTVERHGPTLVVTVEREEGNRFTPAMIVELGDILEGTQGEHELRFLRLRARGPAFCLGREVPESGARPRPDAVRGLAASIVRVNELFQRGPLVTVAEVQGDAAGFGAGLVGNADMAVAAESARFAFPEILAGYAPAVVIGWLSRAVPRKRAFEMVTTGAWVDADVAFRDGLITEVVPGDGLEARVDERIQELATLDATALRDAKCLFARTRAMDPASAAAASIDSLALALAGGAS